jgi:isocitrate dehydrogenase
VEERILELTRLIEEDSKKRGELVTRLEEIQASEQVNEYGIMLNSILTARIIEGRGIKAPNGTNIIVNMMIEGQSAQTEPVMVQNGVEPVWKEVISFDIGTGRENLLI